MPPGSADSDSLARNFAGQIIAERFAVLDELERQGERVFALAYDLECLEKKRVCFRPDDDRPASSWQVDEVTERQARSAQVAISVVESKQFRQSPVVPTECPEPPLQPASPTGTTAAPPVDSSSTKIRRAKSKLPPTPLRLVRTDEHLIDFSDEVATREVDYLEITPAFVRTDPSTGQRVEAAWFAQGEQLDHMDPDRLPEQLRAQAKQLSPEGYQRYSLELASSAERVQQQRTALSPRGRRPQRWTPPAFVGLGPALPNPVVSGAARFALGLATGLVLGMIMTLLLASRLG